MKFLTAILLSLSLPLQGQMVINPYRFGGVPPGPTYVLDEDFEGDTSAWTAVTGAGGTASLTYTPALSGTKSAQVLEVSGDATLTRSLPSTYDALEGSFQFRTPSSNSSNSSNRNIFRIESSTDSALGTIMMTSSSSGTLFAINVKMVSTNGTATSATFAVNTTIYVWWEWSNITDVMTVWWNTTDTKPEGDGTKTTTASGTTGAPVAKLRLIADQVSWNHVFDEILISEP